jgi:hypothetical protein
MVVVPYWSAAQFSEPSNGAPVVSSTALGHVRDSV